jgi:hypothetical protein
MTPARVRGDQGAVWRAPVRRLPGVRRDGQAIACSGISSPSVSRRVPSVVLARATRTLDNRRMPAPSSPAPWTFAEHMYGIAHCLIDRDGRMIGCNLPIGNGPLLDQAPAMAAVLRDLVAGESIEILRQRADVILSRVDGRRQREPGEDDE